MSPDPIRGEQLRAEVADMLAALGAAPIEPAPLNRWTHYAPDLTPTAVAKLFIAEAFEADRRILGQQVSGSWNGRRFDGYFHLEGGTACYRITCEQGGRYTIWRE